MERTKLVSFIVALVFFSSLAFAQEESITFTTYYPSPYGSYNQLQTNSFGVGDNNGNGVLDADDSPPTTTPPYGDVWIAGKVGIGTTNPEAKLHLRSNFPSGGPTIILENQNATGHAAIDFRNSSSQLRGNLVYIPSGGPTDPERLALNQGVTGSPIITTINEASGNVGIGTVSPAGPLYIDSNTNVYDILSMKYTGSGGKFLSLGVGDESGVIEFDQSGRFRIQSQAARGNSVGTTRLIIMGDTGNVGIGTVGPASRLDLGGGCMTGSICSDARMKKNIESLPDDEFYLAKVMRLKGASFEWKNLKDGKRYVGLIAQDVEKVLPEVVMTSDSNEGQKGLSCIGLGAVLVEAIKEQQREIEELKAEIHRLKRKL